MNYAKVSNSDKNKLSKTLQIPSGSYAIAIFQDTNNNKVLDKNFFGIPKKNTALVVQMFLESLLLMRQKL
ncbi:hypothetical protein CRYPD_1154 [uncultured Candidatus Thioglobus sp.]|nr:hypothetical protein CRYPD_1154 [uncultured Candidatus Thioglobus sp.]